MEPDQLEANQRRTSQGRDGVHMVTSTNQLPPAGWMRMVLPDLGPYTIDYTSSGRYMVMAGRKGHLAIMDLHTLKLVKDFQGCPTMNDLPLQEIILK